MLHREKKKDSRQKEKGIVKTAKDMTRRDQRKASKIWRENAVKQRRRLALQSISQAPPTPPSSGNEAPRNPDRRVISVKKKSDLARGLKNNAIKKQKRKIS